VAQVDEGAAVVEAQQPLAARGGLLEKHGVFCQVDFRVAHSNAWKFETGRFLDPSGWSEGTPPAAFSPECLAAYTAAVSAHVRQG
jgi:hypothetical protein